MTASSSRAWVAAGVVVGVTWAAGLRGWMVQLVGDASVFSWSTEVLVLLPGAAVGGLTALAAVRHAQGRGLPRGIVWSPALFATALLDPTILRAFVSTGEGSGALMVAATALAGGAALSRRRWSAGRVLAAVVAVAGMLLLTAIGTMAAPFTTPRGAWVCLLGATLMAVLVAASSVVHRGGTGLTARSLPWVGAVAGLAWAGSLRALMAAVVGDGSTASWLGTFGWVLAPGAAVGALLGWAELERRRGRPHRLLVWSPVLFVAVLVPGLVDLDAFLASGIGGGAVGVPAMAVIGAHALAARRGVTRAVCALVLLGGLAVWLLTAESVGGPGFALTTPRGTWATLFYVGLLGTAALATAVPLRPQPQTSPRDGSRRIAATSAR
ncbi:hypothetical protein [Oryzobacter terrae]|uniref:hypothetical protein n=1 Tax=Oryzobacter terrae TaxID=1620385 RepID=UPI003672E811